MGLGDRLKAVVLSKYTADISDHKRKLKQLRGAERDAAKERLQALEEGNDKLEGHVNKLLEVAGVVAGVGGAWVTAQASLKTYMKTQQLTSAAAGADLGGLRRETRGLVNDLELLEFASKAQNGAFKATQQEMEAVIGLLPILQSQGYDTEAAFEELTRAMVEGNTEGLKQFGIQIKAQSDTVEGFNELIAGAADLQERFGESASIAGEGMLKAVTDSENAMNNLKSSIGELVVRLAPAIELLGQAIDRMTFGLKILQGETGSLGTQGSNATKQTILDDFSDNSSGLRFQWAGWEEVWENLATGATGGPEFLKRAKRGQLEAFLASLKNRQKLLDRMAQQALQAQREERMAGQKGARGSMVSDAFGSIREGIGGIGGSAFRVAGEVGDAAGRAQEAAAEAQRNRDRAVSSLGAGADELIEKERALEAEREARIANRQTSFLESMFGKVDEFNVYRAAFEGLTASVTTAYEAWLRGQESFGKAFKKAIGEALVGLSVQMMTESIKHLAYGAGRLAFSDGAGATKHFIAAAKFGAGAAAAGYAARKWGGVADGASSANADDSDQPSAPGGSLGGRNSQPQQRQGSSVTVFVGSEFSQGDRRQQGERLKRTLRDAGVKTGDGNVVFA